jgi:AcrR family transcriptional regulator
VTKSELSPNHQARRQQLVQAAQRVLARDGRKGATSRAIAAESGLNNGLVYYYFTTVDAVIDAAVAGMVDEIVASIERASAGHEDPAHRFWSVIEAHLEAYGGPPGRTLVWMEFWTDAVRAGRIDEIARIEDAVIDALVIALEAADVPEAGTRARAICAYVTGVALRRAVRPQSTAELRAEILTMSGGLLMEEAAR